MCVQQHGQRGRGRPVTAVSVAKKQLLDKQVETGINGFPSVLAHLPYVDITTFARVPILHCALFGMWKDFFNLSFCGTDPALRVSCVCGACSGGCVVACHNGVTCLVWLCAPVPAL